MDERQLNEFNQTLRVNPGYRQFLQSIGVTGPLFERGFELSDQQRKAAEQWIRQNVGDVGDLEVDAAGNVNQNEGFGKQLKRYGIPAAIGASMFIPGVGPAVLGGLKAVGSGVASATGAAGTATGAGTGAGGGMGIWETILGAAGGAFRHGAASEANNRGVNVDVELEQEKLRQQAIRDFHAAILAREQEGRAGRQDAWKAMQQAQYVQNATGAAPGFAGKYSRSIAAPTDAERTGASVMEAEVMKRLEGGNPVPMPTDPNANPFTVPDRYRKPSVWEQIMGYGGAGLGLLGAKDRQ